MREVEFRGKVMWNGNHVFSGDWVSGFYVYKSINDKHIIMIESPEVNVYDSYFKEIEVVPETVGQYIGLKDKNERKIYEGDIVLITVSEREYRLNYDNEPVRGVVRYELPSFYVDFQGTLGMMLDNGYDQYEVLGNIYDNKELMGEGFHG